MKLSRLGICARSDGTLGLSCVKCRLSKTRLITCLIDPVGELSAQPVAGVVVAATAAVPPIGNSVDAGTAASTAIAPTNAERRFRRIPVASCTAGVFIVDLSL